jgi:tetratricopeptide (TPR) repeat protein
VLGLLLLGAASPLDPLQLVRQGDAAFTRGDYGEALNCYQRAEERITEPGLAAYNKAVTLYRLEKYAEAEACYRQCLTDAQGQRRAAALFGLGNSLVRQSDHFGARALREAIACYHECLRQECEDRTLVEDTRNNLELAKLLLLDAREDPKNTMEPPNHTEGNDIRPRPSPPDGDHNPGPDGSGDQAPGPPGRGSQQPQPGPDGAANDPKAKGGVGNLPPVPDEGDLVPIPPDIAAALLKQAGDRVRQSRQEALPAPRDPVGVLDR